MTPSCVWVAAALELHAGNPLGEARFLSWIPGIRGDEVPLCRAAKPVFFFFMSKLSLLVLNLEYLQLYCSFGACPPRPPRQLRSTTAATFRNESNPVN
jgi:hypothetical protein